MSIGEVTLELPDKLLPLMDPYDFKAIFGGRGSSKSHSIAGALLTKGWEQKKRILCGREVQNSIKDSVKQLLADKIKHLGFSDFYHVMENEIRAENGTTIRFTGLGKLSIDQIKSMEGVDLFWGAEAQTFSERSLEVLIPTIRAEGSEMWFDWNPRWEEDPIDQLFRGDVVPDNSFVQRINWDENPWFPERLDRVRLYDLHNKPDRYAHIWEGEYEPQAIGALWNRKIISACRRFKYPDMKRIVVAIDPAIENEPDSDEHGITVCGQGSDDHGYLLADGSLKGTPRECASKAVALYDYWDADAIIYEKNNGGLWIKDTLKSVRQAGYEGISILPVNATRGKYIRAEPISSLYESNTIHHVGTFPELEQQMCMMVSGDYEGKGSPDRVCSAVWGFTHLFPKIVNKTKGDSDPFDLPPLKRF